MKKRFKSLMSCVLVVLMLFSCVPISGFAGTSLYSTSEAVKHTFGDGLTWSFDDKSGTLSIDGQGAIPDYDMELSMTGYPELDIYEYLGMAKTSTMQHKVQLLSDSLNSKEISVNEVLASVERQNTAEIAEESDEEPTLSTDPVPWKEYLSKVNSVVIGEGITSIGSAAFALMLCLESVSLPSTLITIGNNAFTYCFQLTSLNIPYGVTTISEEAFGACTSLENVTFPTTLKIIGDNAFAECFSLSKIVIPEGIEEIGDGAFSGCCLVDSISIPEGYCVANDVFDCFFNLQEVHNASKEYSFLENNIDYLYYMSEKNKSSYVNYMILSIVVGVLSELFPEKLSLDDDIYAILFAKLGVSSESELISLIEECSKEMELDWSLALESLTIFCGDESAEHTATKKYYINHKLSESDELHDCFDLSGSVTDTLTWKLDKEKQTLYFEGTGEIPDYEDYTNTPWYYLSGKYNSIVLGYSEETEHASVSITKIGANAFSRSRISSIFIPDSVTEIGKHAFSYCPFLQSVFVGEGVTDIDQYSFTYCENLKEFEVDKDSQSFASSSGSLFSNDYERLLIVPPKASSLTIPSETIFIGYGYYVDCYDSSALDDITLDSFSVDTDNKYFSEENGVLYNKEKTKLLKCITGSGKIEIPRITKYINSDAFNNCNGVTDIVIPKLVAQISLYQFSDCPNLESVTILNPNCEMPTYSSDFEATLCGYDGSTAQAYANEYNIEFISLGTPPAASDYDFIYEENDDGDLIITGYDGTLKDISIPDTINEKTVVAIGNKAFEDSYITTVVIPDTVTSIGDYAFSQCSNLTNVTIPSSVKSIGEFAFYYCNGLTSVTIPKSVTFIGYDAFVYCDDISVTILNPNCKFSLTLIDSCGTLYGYEGSTAEEYAKEHNVKFVSIGSIPIETTEEDFETSVNEDGTVTIIGYSGASRDISIPETIGGKTVTSIGEQAFKDSLIQSVIIPNTVTNICKNAFMYCYKLTSVTIPNSVTSIGNLAFYGCTSLTSITVDSNNTKYSSDNSGVLFNKDKTELIKYPIGNTQTSYEVPNSVTIIDDYAFRDCKNLTSIIIPNSVTTIEDYAFSSCTSLTSVTIPDSVTSIGNAVFYGCTSLTSITISNSVTSIGYNAFSGCTSLTSITIPDSVTTIDDYAFRGCTSLTSITIPNSVTSIYGSAFYGCTSLTSITIPNSVTSIGSDAFYGCTNLTIYGYNGSYAETYANDNNIPFKDVCTHGEASHTAFDAVAETCTEDGYTAGTYCNECERWIGGHKTIKAHHTDEDNDDICDICGEPTEPSIKAGETKTIDVAAGKTTYLAFRPKVTGKYTFTSTSSYDTYGYLYDANLKQITYNDDGGSGSNFKITYSLEGGTKYYFGAKFYSSSKSGSFEVTLSCEHVWDSGVIDPDSTCIVTGTKTYTCTVCGATKTEAVAKKSHNLTKTAAVAATCETDGNKDYWTCSVCEKVYADEKATTETTVKDMTIGAIGHAYVGTITTQPTCTEKGAKTYVCKNDKSHTYTEDVPAKGHTLTKTAAVAATCETDGNKDYWTCSVCEKVYADKKATTETTAEKMKLTALGHDFTPDAKRVNTLNDGTHNWLCANGCGLYGTTQGINKTTKCDYKETASKAATCTEKGYITYTCKDCGYGYSDFEDELGHDLVNHDKVAATCTKDGNEKYDTCSRCDYTTFVVINKLGHDYSSVVTQPTCTEKGYTTYTCSRCNDTYKGDYVAANGHSYGDWQTKTEPKCTTAGSKYRVCGTCGYEDTATIKALGHSYSSQVVEPTCSTKGYTVHTCCVCGNTYKDTYVNTVDHTYSDWTVDAEATVLSEGSKHRTCTVCEHVEKQAIERIKIDIDSNKDYGLANFTVVNAQTKEPIKGASIFVSTENDGENTFFTDDQGKVSIILPVGKQTISAYGKGCLTRSISIDVESGTNDIPEIGISEKPVYEVELKHHLMTNEEISEAGIDTSSIKNQNVYQYELKLEFTAETIRVYKTDEKIIDPQPVVIKQPTSDDYIIVMPLSEICYLLISGDVRWQKEIFDVEMLIINNSKTDTLEDLTATLDLPNGLSLADMSGAAQHISQHIDLIDSGESSSLHWYVRGDEPGSYKVNAHLSGVIMPFNEPISNDYVADSLLHVYGGNALKLEFEFPNIAYYGQNYPVKMSLINTSGITLYNVSHIIKSVEQGRVIHYNLKDEIEETVFLKQSENLPEGFAAVFKPGDKITFEIDNNILFESKIIENKIKSWVNVVDGTQSILKTYNFVSKMTEDIQKYIKIIEDRMGCIEKYMSGVEPGSKADQIYDALYTVLINLISDYGTIGETGDKIISLLTDFSTIAHMINHGEFKVKGNDNPITSNVNFIANLDNAINKLSTSEASDVLSNLQSFSKYLSEKHFDETRRKFDIYDSLRSAISNVPVWFELAGIYLNEDPCNNTSIPWSYKVTTVENSPYSVIDYNEYYHSLFNAIEDQIIYDKVPFFAYCILNADDVTKGKEARKTVYATEDKIKELKANDPSGEITWTVHVENNSKLRTLMESDIVLSSDNKNATYKNGVLTFTGTGTICILATNKQGGTVVVENSDGAVYTYDICVVENHECVPDSLEIILPPTESEDGYGIKCCSKCGAIMDIEVLDHNNLCSTHSFTDTVLMESTCSVKGITSHECITCGFTQTEFTEKTSHVEELKNKTSATCTSSGYTGDIYCSVCGELICEGESINPIDHIYSTDWTVDKEPTCTKEGSKSYHCIHCSNKTDVTVIAKAEHSYIHSVVKPNCTTDGYTLHTCSVCGISYTDNTVSKTGHNDHNGDGYCDTCGKLLVTVEKCDCMCHETGFKGFIYKIARIFWKLFKTKKYCSCGQAHY